MIDIEDKSTVSRIKDIHYLGRAVHFPPKGYMTGDEFERRCIANISKFYHDKGLL
jgi:hypothetical protein